MISGRKTTVTGIAVLAFDLPDMSYTKIEF